VRDDGRSRRVAVVPDAYLNPVPSAADRLAAFLDDGYEVALADPDDVLARRLAERLAADGREIRESVAP